MGVLGRKSMERSTLYTFLPSPQEGRREALIETGYGHTSLDRALLYCDLTIWCFLQIEGSWQPCI